MFTCAILSYYFFTHSEPAYGWALGALSFLTFAGNALGLLIEAAKEL